MMKHKYGDDVRFAVAQPRRTLLQRFGAPGVADLAGAVEERALWARYGL